MNRKSAFAIGYLLIALAGIGAAIWIVYGLIFVPAILSAAREGNLSEVVAELEDGADANLQWRTPHFELFKMGDDFEQNFSPRIEWEVQTPLFGAASGGHVEIVRHLLNSGADPSVACGRPAMFYGPPAALEEAIIQRAPTDVIELLLEAGANPYPAVQRAAEFSKWPLFALLAEAWESEGYRDEDRNKLFGYASLRRDGQGYACAELVSWSRSTTELLDAARDGSAMEVGELLAAGSAVNETNRTGWTALHWACAAGNFDDAVKKVERLLAAGANPEAASQKGCTPLLLACGIGNLEVVQLLLKAGVSVQVADSRQWTPLHEARWWRHSEIVRELVAAGADETVVDQKGETPRVAAGNVPVR